LANLDVNLKNRILKQTYQPSHDDLKHEICDEERTVLAFFYKSHMETLWDWKNSHYWADVVEGVTDLIYDHGLDEDIKVVSYDFYEKGLPDEYLDNPLARSPMILFFDDVQLCQEQLWGELLQVKGIPTVKNVFDQLDEFQIKRGYKRLP